MIDDILINFKNQKSCIIISEYWKENLVMQYNSMASDISKQVSK